MCRTIRSKADGDAALKKSRCIRYSLSAVAERAVARFHIILFQQILLIFREQNAVRRQKTLIQHTKLFYVLDRPHSKTLQKEIDLWQAEGGLLITFSGNETFAESQRSAFKEAPVDFLKNILDEETTSRLLAKRNTNYQKYYTISDLLENTRIRNRPNTVLYGGLILVYLVLAGPGLYFFLKKTGKRQYLWGAICACSAVFVMLISLFGQSTRLKAPVLTYVREIWQYDTYQKDYINFCAQAPYNASYELYLDPSYDLVTYNRMDYMSNSTAQPETEDAEYEKTEISFGEQKNRAEISNQAAFALNEFGMQRMETLDEGEGLKGTFHFWDQKISGTVENKTGYDLESCVIAVPGYCALIGDIKNGETITLD